MPAAQQRLPEHLSHYCRELAQSQTDPTSAFIYDLDALAAHLGWVRSHLPAGVELYYAIKANSEPAILRTLAPLVDGFEISSGGEIQRAFDCPQSKPVIFSGPGKLDSDLARALDAGVEMIHIESLNEIHRLNALAGDRDKQQPVLLRINPILPDRLSTKLSMAGAATPFGIEERQLPEAVARVEASSHLELYGFHVHAMSHQTQVERHLELLDWLLDKWPVWQALAVEPQTLRYFNVGGGMGVDYTQGQLFDWPALCRHLERRLKWYPNPPVIRFEPGRFLTAFCGYYLMQILDIKHNHGEDFAVCRGGTHQFRLPAAQQHDHPVFHLPMQPDLHQEDPGVKKLTVVGQLCTPKDVLARGVAMRNPKVGDLLVLPLAGAYGYNISHADFLCHPRPGQYYIDTETSAQTLSTAVSNALPA